MCNPALIVAGIGAATSIAGQAQQKKAAKQAANDEQAALNYQALVEEDMAQADATQIRRQGEEFRGQAIAGAAASGVKIGEGSALDAERRIVEDTEVDAATAILTGKRSARSLRMGGQRIQRSARDAGRAADLNSAATLLSFGAKAYGGGG